jgi:hypothetical protein
MPLGSVPTVCDLAAVIDNTRAWIRPMMYFASPCVRRHDVALLTPGDRSELAERVGVGLELKPRTDLSGSQW